MKYLIMVGDGMADRPVDELGGRTPLEAAHTPHLDFLAREGALGLVRNIPEDMPCGSDVANMSILGYDPRIYYTGRSPLEAASIGVHLAPDEVAFRCNLVTLDFTDSGPVMADYSAGHISTEAAAPLIEILDRELGDDCISFHAGFQYRHLMVWKGGENGMETTPPHDITGRPIRDYLPKGPGAEKLIELIERSHQILGNLWVSVERWKRGLNMANSIWLWGQGKPLSLPSFYGKFGLYGAMITAVDLLKGLAIYAGMEVINVPGATGYLDTNYAGKVEAAIDALRRKDLVYLHVEAPDETGHAGDWRLKIQAIEDFDAKVVGPMLEATKGVRDLRLIVLPDHPTPVSIKTHGREPVPFVIYPRGSLPGLDPDGVGFSERYANRSKLFIDDGTKLMGLLIKGGIE
mgnify:CR=1 FL=1